MNHTAIVYLVVVGLIILGLFIAVGLLSAGIERDYRADRRRSYEHGYRDGHDDGCARTRPVHHKRPSAALARRARTRRHW